MSRVLEDRVWAAAPLSLADRCVLLAVAHDVPDGRAEVHVNRTALATRLQAQPAQIMHGLNAGAAVGLCTLYKQKGIVAFAAYDHALGTDPKPAPAVAVIPARPEDVTIAKPKPRPQDLINEFVRQWEARYAGQRYAPTMGRDHKLAADLLRRLSPGEIKRRIATFLAKDEPYYERRLHAFSVFVSSVNECVTVPDRAPRGVPDYEATKALLKGGRRG